MYCTVLGGYLYLPDERHGAVEFRLVECPRAGGFYVQVEQQAVVQLLVVGQVDILGIFADVQPFVHSEGDGLRLQRRKESRSRLRREPRGKGVKMILPRSTTVVADGGGEGVRLRT